MKQKEIEGLIGTVRFINDIVDYDPISYDYYVKDFDLIDLILDSMGFPKDTTVELGLDHPDVFCQDYLTDIICDLNTPVKMAYRQLIRELNNLETSNKDD